ncbi:hypothetical protein V6N13_144464 [Hibiscus sabdariffa]
MAPFLVARVARASVRWLAAVVRCVCAVGENRIRPGQGGAGAGAGESHLGFLFPRHSISYHIPIYFTLQFHGNWLDQILARAKKASGFTSGFGI